MLEGVLTADGVAAILLATLIGVQQGRQRFLLPRAFYVLGAVTAVCGWIAYLCIRGSAVMHGLGLAHEVWRGWTFLAPPVLPFEAGFLVQISTKSSWRWCWLIVGVAALLSPILAGLIFRMLGGRAG